MNSIRKYRTKTGKTQEQIAKILNINRSTVAKWETGESLPRAEMLPKLAKTINCTVDELLQQEQKIKNNTGGKKKEKPSCKH